MSPVNRSRTDTITSQSTEDEIVDSTDGAVDGADDGAGDEVIDKRPLAEASAELADDSTPWLRLHWRTLVMHLVSEVTKGLPVLVGVALLGGFFSAWTVFGLSVTALVIVAAMLRWAATHYRLTADQLQVRRGVFSRTFISVPRDRVRSVDLHANLSHRVFFLVKVAIGTGRSDRERGGELHLEALSKRDATALRGALLGDGADERAPGVELARMGRRWWLRFGPFTLSGLILGLAGVGAVAQALHEADLRPGGLGALRALVGQVSTAPIWLAVLEVLVAALLVMAVLSTVGYVLLFGRFRLSREPGGVLHLTRGLVSTRAITIEEKRLRGLEYSEPLPLRSVGGARLIAITTGLRVGRGSARGGSILLPPAPRAVASEVAGAVLRDPAPLAVPLTRHDRKARNRRYTRAFGVSTVIVGLLVLLWWLAELPAVWWQVALVLYPVSVLLAADRYRNLGHTVAGGYLISRFGSLVRRRFMLATPAVVGWRLRQSLFQRRVRLVTVVATTAGGRQSYRVPDVGRSEALRITLAATPELMRPFLEPLGGRRAPTFETPPKT
jgi:putative membrane protein